MSVVKGTLRQQLREAYESVSLCDGDWHPTIRETQEKKIAAQISNVLCRTDLNAETTREELSLLLANLFVTQAQRFDGIRSGPWD